MIRQYNGDVRRDAAKIASECILEGSSAGWFGRVGEREAVEAILKPFGIVYADEFRGEWEPALSGGAHGH